MLNEVGVRMGKLAWVAIIAVIGFGRGELANADEHFGKNISLLEVSTAGCYFFKLEEVSQADPAVPNNDWFAIPTSQANAKEVYSLLMAARLSGQSLCRVLTTGGTSCGGAQILTLNL